MIDEETKIHKEVDGEIVTGFMPELPNDHKLCPIQSFLTYSCSVSSEKDDLWQPLKITQFPEDPRNCVW